jgi:O-antigen ligase
MVAFMPFALLRAAGSGSALRRLSGAAIAVLMAGAVVATGSRSGTLGFVAVLLLGGWHVARRRPALAFAAALVVVLAMPAVPNSYWERMASITDASKDQSGSRETRSTLFREGWSAFLDRPITGVGAGQFKNYSPETRRQAWDETHNVLLQVAAELGIFGLAVFTFLIVRAYIAGIEVRRLLRRIGATGGKTSARVGGPEPLPPAEWKELDAHAAATMVAVAGWLVCGMFASVAYNWTFYYLLALAVAPREFLTERLGPRRARSRYAVRAAAATAGVRT